VVPTSFLNTLFVRTDQILTYLSEYSETRLFSNDNVIIIQTIWFVKYNIHYVYNYLEASWKTALLSVDSNFAVGRR